jgi:hypothetical protein
VWLDLHGSRRFVKGWVREKGRFWSEAHDHQPAWLVDPFVRLGSGADETFERDS